MLDHLPQPAHRLQVRIEPALHRLQHCFMLPAGDTAVQARGAAARERSGMADRGPIAAQSQSTLDIAVVVSELLARRTAVGVLLGQVDEVLLAEAAISLS